MLAAKMPCSCYILCSNMGSNENLVARLFGMNESTFESIVVGLVSAVFEHTYEGCVQC